MQHGPILVANNLLLSDVAINSQGIAFAHNLFSGSMGINLGDGRVTPFQEAHSTKIVGMYPDKKGDSGDYRFYNNIFCERSDLSSIDKAALTSFAAGNIFLKGAKPSKFDKDTIVKPDCDSGVRLKEKPDGWYLSLTVEKSWCDAVKRAPVTTALLGNAKVSNCAFENPDGTPLKMDTDYLGKTRSATTPTPGPFENLGIGPLSIKVWQQ